MDTRMTPPRKPGQHKSSARRAHKRSQLLYYLPVVDAGTGVRLGVLADLSLEGLLLVGEHRLEPGRRVKVQIYGDPTSELAGDVELILEGEVRWSGRDANPSRFAAGIHFLHPDASTHQAVRTVLQRLGIDAYY